MQWEPVIGLEVHVQLATATKMFCGCAVDSGARPNSRLCPVCLGLPGALPVLNSRAVDLGVMAALALGCNVRPVSVFARKNYFYPDLPKGFQISQHDLPLALDGHLEWAVDGAVRRVGIARLHMEEDAGKSLHDGLADARLTAVDFNRSGVPLIEIVTRPDMRSAAEAAGFFGRLREVLVGIGVTAGNMEEGNLRCDANVSVRPAGTDTLGTPVEVKNLNSFRYVRKALEHEIERQVGVLERGGTIEHETRLWDLAAGRTVVMRSKEEAHDYRFFREPDLPPVRVSEERLAALRASLPELPVARRERLATAFGLSEYDAAQVGASAETTAYFEASVAAGVPPKTAANWITGEVTRLLKEAGLTIQRSPVTPEALAGLVRTVEAGTISISVAKDVLSRMWASGMDAQAIIAGEGLALVDDEAALAAIVKEVVANNPKGVAQYRAGKELVFGFFVGQVMKATRGKADPALVNRLVARELERA